MADMNRSEPIPKGWEWRGEPGSKNASYWCPVTGQHFFTYEDLMRYVNYAEREKLSIYAEPSNNKLKKKGLLPRRGRPSLAGRGRFSGQSSRQSSKRGKKAMVSEESTDEDKDSTDEEMNTKAELDTGKTGLEVELSEAEPKKE